VLGYGFVVGLAPGLVEKAETIFKGYNVPTEPPPPPVEPPPPTIDATPTIPTMTAPVPIVRAPTVDTVRVPITPADPTPPIQRPFERLRELSPAPVPLAKEPPKPVPPARPADPPQVATGAAIRTIGFGDADYPDAAMRAGESGVTRVRVTVGTDGRASGCAVTGSSGSTALDRAACRLVESRSRFAPAKDAAGGRLAQTLELPIT